MNPETLLNPGTDCPLYGKIAAVLFTGGERFYMMIKNETISLMPGDLIEKLVRDENHPRKA
jgi:hypothetical protein